jgi:hypothetical protein
MAFTERKFIAVNRKIDGETTVILKEGALGTGLTLPYHCGFCKGADGLPTAAFRTQRERNQHTNRCPN